MSQSSLSDVKKGSFVRKESIYRNRISANEFPAAKGRYILYVSLACPWASRCLAAIAIKGLQDVIQVVVTSPVWGQTRPDVDDHEGWLFDPSFDSKCGKDPVFGAKSIREIYEKAANQPEGGATRFTVPILLDAQTKQIVNNESSEIVRFLNSEFNDFARHPEINLRPDLLRSQIDTLNDSIYDSVNNGVYRCGFAQSQEAYDVAVAELFNRLDELEETLENQRFLVKGGNLTETDIRLFVTLVRFDDVYAVHFKTSQKLIREYPNLSAYIRDVYQTGGLASSVDRRHIMHHYYRSHKTLNPYGIVPLTQATDLSLPHHRDRLDA